jgi:acetoin utilization deacetylase AcuC-like enzyme
LKIVFHDKYFDVYSVDPASAEGRLDSAHGTLKENCEFVQPELAREEDLLLVHSQTHADHVRQDTHLFEVASLAVGGAICASEMVLDGEPAFGLIRLPGHHASPNSCWGFCYFNNIAIAIRRLIHDRKIRRALIIDFDLHFGDGTNNTLAGDANVVYHHMGQDPGELEGFLSTTGDFDMLAVSAGFDRGIADWGGTLTDEDYEQIGRLLKEFSQSECSRKTICCTRGRLQSRDAWRNHVFLHTHIRVVLGSQP